MTAKQGGEGLGGKHEAVRQQLRTRILSGHYEPGDPIPERAVADELGASRIPVREALRQLERDGLVTIVAQRGAHVRQFSAENMQSLYQARESLEGMAARLAAERADETYLAPFTVQFEGLIDGTLTMSPGEASELGNAFHDAIAKGSRNATVIELLAMIHDRVLLCRRLAYGHASQEWHVRAASEHLAIADAISRRDPDRAERTMREHVSTWAGFLQTRLAGDSPHPSRGSGG